MTRKDFEVVAEIVARIWLAEEIGRGVEVCQKSIHDILEKTNPNYNPERFWGAVEKIHAEDIKILTPEEK